MQEEREAEGEGVEWGEGREGEEKMKGGRKTLGKGERGHGWIDKQKERD